MTIYLTKGTPTIIDLTTIKCKKIQNIIEQYWRYRLETILIDITNDIGIPVYLTMLIDRTGLGPAISLGLKAGMDSHNVIIGSMEEAILTRPWIRKMIKSRTINNTKASGNTLHSIEERALYWFHSSMLAKIRFLIRGSVTLFKTTPFLHKNKKQELKTVINMLNKRNYNVYYIDITTNLFKKLNYFVYKIIIPGLQPLYLDEGHKTLQYDRLNSVSRYFHKNALIINEVPHPLL